MSSVRVRWCLAMVRVSVAVQVLAVVVLGPFMVMVEIKSREKSHLDM